MDKLTASRKALAIAGRHADRILIGAVTGSGSPDDYLSALEAIKRVMPDYDDANRANDNPGEFMGALMCCYQDAGVILGVALGLRMRR